MEQRQLSIYFRLNEEIHENMMADFVTQLNHLSEYKIILFCHEKLQSSMKPNLNNLKQVYYRDDEDYLEQANHHLTQDDELYVMILEGLHVLNEKGINLLLNYAKTHRSDVLFGYASYKPVQNGLQHRDPTFQFEKYKKFHINISLFNEPTLLHTISQLPTKIIRREFLLENTIQISLKDLKAKYIHFQLNIMSNSDQITYIPVEIVRVEKNNLDRIEGYLTECNQIRNSLESTYKKQFEIGVFSEIYRYIMELYSNVSLQKDAMYEQLNAIRKEIEQYDFALLTKLKQEYYTFYSLLQRGNLNELTDYIILLNEALKREDELKLTFKKYNQYKSNSSKILLNLYQMYENVVKKNE